MRKIGLSWHERMGAMTLLLGFLAPMGLAQTDIPLVPDGIKVTAVIPDGNFAGNPGDLKYSVSGSVLNFTLDTFNSDDVPVLATGTWEMQAPSSAKGFEVDTGIDFVPKITVQFKVSYDSPLRLLFGGTDSKFGFCNSVNTDNFLGTRTLKCDVVDHLEVESTPSGRRAYLDTNVHVARNSRPGQSIAVRVYYRLPAAAGCPASAMASSSPQGRAADASCKLITLDTALPFNSDPIPAFGDSFPAFCGFGKYTYNGPNKAHIFLELVDQKGNIVARSIQAKTIDFPSGSQLSWGNGCTKTDPKQLIFITEQKKPVIDVPTGIRSAMASSWRR